MDQIYHTLACVVVRGERAVSIYVYLITLFLRAFHNSLDWRYEAFMQQFYVEGKRKTVCR